MESETIEVDRDELLDVLVDVATAVQANKNESGPDMEYIGADPDSIDCWDIKTELDTRVGGRTVYMDEDGDLWIVTSDGYIIEHDGLVTWPELTGLLSEYCQVLDEHGHNDELDSVVDSLSQTVEEHGSRSDSSSVVDDTEQAGSDTVSAGKQEAIEQFVDEHESIESYSEGSSWSDYDFYLHYNLDGVAPGQSNIGTDRTDEELNLQFNGYEIDIVFIEEASVRDDHDLLVGVRLIESGSN